MLTIAFFSHPHKECLHLVCLAALAHWRRGDLIETEEIDDLIVETPQPETVGPLIEHLRRHTSKWSFDDLAVNDTKYNALAELLSGEFDSRKNCSLFHF